MCWTAARALASAPRLEVGFSSLKPPARSSSLDVTLFRAGSAIQVWVGGARVGRVRYDSMRVRAVDRLVDAQIDADRRTWLGCGCG